MCLGSGPKMPPPTPQPAPAPSVPTIAPSQQQIRPSPTARSRLQIQGGKPSSLLRRLRIPLGGT